MPAEPLDDLMDDLRDAVERYVAAGFLSAEEIVECAIETVVEEDDDPRRLRPATVHLLERALAAHARAQATWPPVTDCDRLDEAFAELETRGIVARQDFSCCGTCGAAEILEEMEGAAAAGVAVRGYVFYHAQDTESAVEGHGLCLSYGTGADDEGGALAIGREIVAVLARHGLAPAWDGRWGQRITLPLDWKRRRAEVGS